MSEPKRYDDQEVWKTLYFAGSTEGWVQWRDYARLKAEVERLRKAGDAMAMTLQSDYNGVPYEPHVIINAIIYWRAAKEGKPSV